MSGSDTPVESNPIRKRFRSGPSLGVRGSLIVAGAIATGWFVTRLVPFDLVVPQAAARDFQRKLAITFLDGLLAAYAVFGASAVIILALLVVGRYGWIGSFAPFGGRARAQLCLLCVSLWFGLVFCETGAWAWSAWLHRSPHLPVVGSQPDRSNLDRNSTAVGTTAKFLDLSTRFARQGTGGSVSSRAIKILVIGESSGRGEPYHPWLSVGQIVAWRLEEVFPKRPIELDIWAYGGATLEVMHNKLASLTYRPDLLIVYVGHNEFQARYAWMREVNYYIDDLTLASATPAIDFLGQISHCSPLCRLVLETRNLQQVACAPPRAVVRELVDRPVCTADETETILSDFQRRLDAIAAYCETIRTTAVFVVPPSNDAGFDPSRSILAPELRKSQRIALARAVAYARALEGKDPAEALRIEREQVERHPGFAELHFRMARLLEQTGRFDEARVHYIQARECDAMPLRCPHPLQQVFRRVAANHPAVILVDGPEVFQARSAHGIVGDQFFHDAQHPNLWGYATLSAEILKQLAARGAFGWPPGRPAPLVDPECCSGHFQIGGARWEQICRREVWFFQNTACIRYDPRFRNERARAYARAAEALRAGCDPARAGIPGWAMPPKPTASHRIPANSRPE
jgi:hypothetical protein